MIVEVCVLIVGARDVERNEQEMVRLHKQLRSVCPSWHVKFGMRPRFENALRSIRELTNLEIVHFTNEVDYNITEWIGGGQKLIPALADHPRKPLVAFQHRWLEELLRPLCVENRILPWVGSLHDATTYRWRERPAPHLQLVG